MSVFSTFLLLSASPASPKPLLLFESRPEGSTDSFGRNYSGSPTCQSPHSYPRGGSAAAEAPPPPPPPPPPYSKRPRGFPPPRQSYVNKGKSLILHSFPPFISHPNQMLENLGCCSSRWDCGDGTLPFEFSRLYSDKPSSSLIIESSIERFPHEGFCLFSAHSSLTLNALWTII